nr:MAG TPA: hypothetical protein [Caudoviricetes sp.]
MPLLLVAVLRVLPGFSGSSQVHHSTDVNAVTQINFSK